MPQNILNVITELKKQYKDDYIIQEGILLNRTFLIDNGFLGEEIRYSKKYYPIYIPGKHPIFRRNSIQYIIDEDLYDYNSDLYNSYNYYEIGVLMREDTPVSNYSKVRVFYSKASDKLYSNMYFEIISTNEKSSIVSGNVTTSNSTYIQRFDSLENKSVCSFAGGNTRRGFSTSFDRMFSQIIGKIILLRNDELALNMYAVAGQESTWFSGAVAGTSKEQSYGFFQLNTKVHTPTAINEYIRRGLNYFNIKNQPNVKIEDLSLTYNLSEWQQSVGYGVKEYPIKRPEDINYDIQLLVWTGYMQQRGYINTLSTIPVFKDIYNGSKLPSYQKAQGFELSLTGEYEKNTRIYYNKYIVDKNKSVELAMNSKNNLLQNPTTFTSPDDKFLISYYS